MLGKNVRELQTFVTKKEQKSSFSRTTEKTQSVQN
jgi:hypothetical protein